FRQGFLAFPTILSGLACLVMALAAGSPAALTASLVVFGFSTAWAYNNSLFYGTSGAPDRNRRVTVHEALLTAGQVLGSLVGGALYQAVSMRIVFLFAAALAGAGFLLQSWMARSRFGAAQAGRDSRIRADSGRSGKPAP
ncbi:MAG TPA: MFS transporter, partial [Magnetospirillaceae bacterium]|nr:MFS transporter [Magnetospirillaceae bacterium]